MSAPMEDPGCELSIVVCTHNRANSLRDLVACLHRQIRSASAELLIIDSASRPAEAQRIRELVEATAGVRLVRLEQCGVTLARNKALQMARAPWVAFVDDDERPTEAWLVEALALTRRLPRDCAACSGNVIPVYPDRSQGRIGPRWSAYLSTIERTGEFDQTEELRFGVGHSVVRVEALLAAGGFDPRLGRVGTSLLSGEEVLLLRQLVAAGWRIWHSDRIEVDHLIEPERLTSGWVRRRAYWEGITTARVLQIADRRRLRIQIVMIMLKFAPLIFADMLVGSFLECNLRLAFARGFMKACIGDPLASPPVDETKTYRGDRPVRLDCGR